MKTLSAASFALLVVATTGISQNPPPPAASPRPTPPASEQLSKALENIATLKPAPREQREQAYAKLLEGQRYVWGAERLRTRAARQHNSKLAREAFQRSVELDPLLSEGYTALAELAINSQPQDADEGIRLASLAAKVNPNNFGARRILARLYTFKARLTNGPFDAQNGQSAITEWRQVAKLDPRNAEAWALLSELYDKTGKTDETIDALGKWLGSATPVDTRFYQMIMGGQNLAPESASIKLGSMLIKAGRDREAIQTLSILIADEPENFAAVDLLRDAIEDATPEAASLAIEPLRQAVFANPSNVPLINLLARAHARAGKIDDAAKLIHETSARLIPTDRASASMLEVGLGDMMARADRFPEAIAAYDAALAARALDQPLSLSDDEREFATHVFEKLIQTLKNADRTSDVRAVVDRSRQVLGKEDLFPDRQLIALYRETGSRPEALAAIRAVRQRVPGDYGFIRLEATLLTETGKVDEGVAMIRKLIDTASAAPQTPTIGDAGGESVTIAVPASDAFSNYLFISNLYSLGNRGKEAAEAANQAYAIARGSERKQIARLTLATAQQNSGDFKGSEVTLRELLKETPGNPIALNNLGYFLLERDERFAEALDLIQQAVKIDPTNPSYLDSLGWAYFKLGKLPEAEKNLKEALRFDSSSGTIHEHLGDVYHKGGKTDLARASWTRAASLHSDATDLARVKKKLRADK